MTLSLAGLMIAGNAFVVEENKDKVPDTCVRICGIPKVTILVVPLKIYEYVKVPLTTFGVTPHEAENVLDTIVVYVAIFKLPLPIKNDVDAPPRLILVAVTVVATKELVLLTKEFSPEYIAGSDNEFILVQSLNVTYPYGADIPIA